MEHVSIRIFNSAGELVRILWEGTLLAGERRVVPWDLTTAFGDPASSGVYLIQPLSLTGAVGARIAIVR